MWYLHMPANFEERYHIYSLNLIFSIHVLQKSKIKMTASKLKIRNVHFDNPRKNLYPDVILISFQDYM